MVVHFLATVNNGAYEHLCTKFCVDLYVIFSLQWGFEAKFSISIVPPTTNLHALEQVCFIHKRMVAGTVSVLPVYSQISFSFSCTRILPISSKCVSVGELHLGR